MPKVTVYVSDGLKARMDAAGESVNWSGEAQQAFQCALAQQEWKTMEDEMEQAIARLRASKADFEAKQEHAGKAAGRRWALRKARFEDLERVAKRAEELGDGGVFAGEELASMMRDMDWGDDEWLGDDLLTDDFADAFVQGALEVHDEVNARL